MLFFKLLKWLVIYPFLRIIIIPDWELNFEKRRLSSWVDFNASDIVF
jgi:hypothetical protein